MKLKFTLLALTVFFAISCKKETDEQTPTKSFTANPDGVYICNEGVFMSGKATITYSDGTEAETIQDVYKIANDASLGDICQSMTKINSKIYLVVNNSSKIEVVQATTMKKATTITGLTSPRYMVQATTDKAYVSDLSANHMSIIDVNTNTITGTINIQGSTEAMLQYNLKMYVTNLSTPYLYVVDVLTDVVEDSILVGVGGNSIQIDENNKLWVLCGGESWNSISASLHRVDPATKTVEQTLTFPAGDYPTRLCINDTRSELFYLNLDVYKMPIIDTALPTSQFVLSAGKSFYGMAYDRVGATLYVSDAIDFQQAGRIHRYTNTGAEIGGYPAGIIPGDFLFLNN